MGKKRKINMTDEKSGKTPEVRTVIDISVERLTQENLKLKAELDTLKKVFVVEEKKLADATSFLEQNERGKARDALAVMGCTYSMEELDRMSLDQLDKLKQHYRFFNPPVFKSSGKISAERKSIYDSLDDVYVPLGERKKTGA